MRISNKKIKILTAVITASTLSPALSSPIANGLSGGINTGYQLNTTKADKVFEKISGTVNRFDFHSQAVGAHIDYDYLISDAIFVGAGLDINHAPKITQHTHKTMKEGDTTYMQLGAHLRTTRNELSGKSQFLFSKKLATAFTVRTGVVLGDVAFDVNAAVMRSTFRKKCASHDSSRIAHSSFSTLRVPNDVSVYPHNASHEYDKSVRRIGYALGASLTFSVAKNFTTSFNYRYEVYPRSKDNVKLGITSHNVFTKFSYHM